MYRAEHPNPQKERVDWLNLNGEWDFEYDFGNSGIERKLYKQASYSQKINVPFCPESKLSGIGNTDFLNAVWYKRNFVIPNDWNDGRVFIHFGAVDYHSIIYINGKEVGTHLGGYTSFKFDITDYLKKPSPIAFPFGEGVSVADERGNAPCQRGDGPRSGEGIPYSTSLENTVVVYAEDDNRHGMQPKGKQADKYYSSGCDYTRTTGIWQTVWLEHTPCSYVEDFKFYPDVQNQKLGFNLTTIGAGKVSVKASFEGKPMGECRVKTSGGTVSGEIELAEAHLWEVGNGNLYDVEITFGEDKIKSYFGLRDIHIDGLKVRINGKSVFQRLVLDQGFYPDGIYTAPTDDDLKKDIELSLAVGFNGARLHQKVFEPRFLYHCDKLGYIVWGEFPNWGIDYSKLDTLNNVSEEWQEAVERDFNHPSIVGWCPFNETWNYNRKIQNDAYLKMIYNITKLMDTTRPCIDTSGNYHVATDIYDVHDYTQDVDEFASHYNDISKGDYVEYNLLQELRDASRQNYNDLKFFGKPFFVSEYGGIRWSEDSKVDGWGYGQAPKTKEEYIARFIDLANVLMDNEYMFGFCYTQLYDVEQEINGIYTYDRKPKFDNSIFKKALSKKAKIED